MNSSAHPSAGAPEATASEQAAAAGSDLVLSPALAQAHARLAATRARLYAELLPPRSSRPRQAADGAGQAADGGFFARATAWVEQTLREASHSAKRVPWLVLASEAVHQWWRKHPLRPVAELAADETRHALTPLVRRHPLLSVAAAAGVGALLIVSKPWRWGVVRQQVGPLPRRATHWFTTQLAQPHLQALLASLLAMSLARARPAAPESAPAEAPRGGNEPEPRAQV